MARILAILAVAAVLAYIGTMAHSAGARIIQSAQSRTIAY